MRSFMDMSEELEGPELWRRQCARNLMDCYALSMEGLAGAPDDERLKALTRLMVDGMTAVRNREDEGSFYKIAAELCRQCAESCDDKAGVFRVYAAIFGDMAGEEATNGTDHE